MSRDNPISDPLTPLGLPAALRAQVSQPLSAKTGNATRKIVLCSRVDSTSIVFTAFP